MRFAAICLLMLSSLSAQAGETDFSTPEATIRTFVGAVKANDYIAARSCWVADSSADESILETISGMSIAARKLVSTVETRFGPDGVKLLGRWHRPNNTNAAIDHTLTNLSRGIVKERTDHAHVTIPWQTGDGDTNPAFLCLKAPIFLKQTPSGWKLDANMFTGSEKVGDLFRSGGQWTIWRDEMMAMKELLTVAERSVDLATFEKALTTKVAALKAKYATK